MIRALAGVVFDGVAYGSLLFLISVGLSVTLGLMNFINLAHGAFAMFGGYLSVLLMRHGLPFGAALPVVFVAMALAGLVIERVFCRRLYHAGPLDQVLLTIGLVFVSMGIATHLWGAGQQAVRLPPLLRGQLHVMGVDLGAYRLFLIALVAAIAGALRALVEHTRFGAQVRACVDNADVAAGLGIPVDRVFAGTFALGGALAGLGGALGIEVLGLDPTFPLKYMVYFLLVVSVGGGGAIAGAAVASVILGVFDVVGKYYVPQAGAFLIYALMVALLVLSPAGLFGRRS